MKKFTSAVTLVLALVSLKASAATDRSYYIADASVQQSVDIYNDGKNTYIEAVQGLVVTGATADGEFYIIKGVPQQIRAFLNGKAISVIRGTPPAGAVIKQAVEPADKAALAAKLTMLADQLAQLKQPGQGAMAGGQPQGATKPMAGADQGPQALAMQTSTRWVTSPGDKNLRILIENWARSIQWTPIWDVDRDIPIDSPDEFTGDFRSALRRVLSATEFGDVSLKPCFYTNSVVRIVRKTAKCNPSE